MVKRSVIIAVFGIVLLGCESNIDMVQGDCDEGFFELPGPDGTVICNPIIEEEESIHETVPDPNYLHDLD